MSMETNQFQKIRNMQKIYDKILDKQLSTIQAIYQILQHKKSIKKIKVGLLSLGKKNSDIEALKWKDKKAKKDFIKLCNDLLGNFQDQHEKSIISTQKLSEMNQQVSKMRKSLSQKGILFQFQNLQIQNNNQSDQQKYQNQESKREDNYNKDAQKSEIQTKNINNHTIHQNINSKSQKQHNQVMNKTQENRSQRSERNISNVSENENIDKEKQQQSLQQDKNTQQQNVLEENKIDQKSHIIQKESKNQQHQQHMSKSLVKDQTKQKIKTQLHHQKDIEDNSQLTNKHKQNSNIITNKQLKSHENNKSSSHANSSFVHEQKLLKKQEHEQKNNKLQDGQHVHKNNQANKKQKYSSQTQWKQIPLPDQYQNKVANNFNKSQQKKLKTLPQQIDNQFYEQDMTSIQQSKVQNLSPKKLPKYNPYLQIMKKLNKNRKPQPQPRNQFQSIYYNYRNKLIIIFAHYVKQLKTQNFTFDAFPNSLDLKTFSVYYKHFKMGEFCKIVDIPKYFKKYAINGAYLNQDGFILLHEKIFQIGDNVPQKINTFISEKEKYSSTFEQQIKKIQESNLSDKEKKSKQIQLLKKKQEFNLKYNQFQDKLKKLANALSQQQINKLIRKIEKKSPSIQNQKKIVSYDQQRLKKIVEAHSGIYKDDIIEKLNQRKRQKQKRHEVQMHRILEKYKVNQEAAQANSGSSFNKSNQSVPHLHKIQGYAKINKIKKHSDLNGKKLEQFLIKTKEKSLQKVKTQAKIKPYFISKQAIQQNNDSQNIENNLAIQKKPQIFRQLSLPKLPKRKMRQQSIYEALKLIDTKNSDLQFIKSLITPTTNSKQDEKILNEFYSKQKLLIQKQKIKKPNTLQNRMKFS